MSTQNVPANSATPAPRGASRKWLIYSVVFGLATIGCILVYRVISGNTLHAQRIATEAAKAEKELAAKAPGSAEAFSALLARRTKEAQETVAKEQAKDTNAKPSDTQSKPGMPLGAPTPPASSVSAGSGSPARTGIGFGGSNGTNPDVDAYAALKESQTREANRRMGSWEKDSTRLFSANTPDPAPLTSDGRGGDQRGKTRTVAGNPTSASEGGSALNAALDSYLKSQSPRASSQNSDEKFLAGANRDLAPPLTVQPGPGPHSVWEGTPIPIQMLTAVSSDVSGPCRAQVASDVYDSQTQSERLIAAGTRLICVYNADVIQGQERLNFAFTLMRFPNGASVALAGMQGADGQGVVGAASEVNTRFWKTFGSSFLVAALAKVAESSNQSAGVTVNLTGSVSGSGAQVLSDIAKQSLQRNMQIKPELRINLGEHLNMIVTRDMVLDPQKTGVKQ